MAILDLAARLAVLDVVIQDRMADMVRKDVLLLELLAKRPGRNGQCVWNVKGGGRNAASAHSGEEVPTAPATFSFNAQSRASLEWARYRDLAAVDGLSADISAMNGPGGFTMANFSDLSEELYDTANNLAIKISQDLYQGTGTDGTNNTIVGTEVAANPATAIYAGIDSGVVTEWVPGIPAANQDAFAVAALDGAAGRKLLLTNAHQPYQDVAGTVPDFATCRSTLFNQLKCLHEERERWNRQIQTIATADGGELDLVKHGTDGVIIDNVKYLIDRHAPLNTFTYFKRDNSEIFFIPRTVLAGHTAQFEASDVRDMQAGMLALTGKPVRESDIMKLVEQRKGRLQPFMHMLPYRGDALQVAVMVQLQARHKVRNRVARLTVTP